MEVIEALKYPIGREEEQDVYHIAFSEPLKVQLITEIQMLPGNLELAIQNLDAAQLETAYRPGGWTVKQVVHHVADSHINAYTRFKLGLTEDQPTIKPYDQEAWSLLPDAEKSPINVSLTLLHALHSRWVTLMESLTEEQWQRTVYHPERKISISLWELLKSYAWHGQHHVAHILQLRQRMNWI
jgi:uncharacterized damage-inducible protein DinB